MLSSKENYLQVLVEHTKPERVANMSEVTQAGGALETFENGPLTGGYDGFGVKWLTTASASGTAVPDCGAIPLKDICDWEDVVTFPNLDEYDWQGEADRILATHDRKGHLLEYGLWNGQFLRIAHLMGFENALCAMLEEPEAYAALVHAITDYKIEVVERSAHYFHPELYSLFIDVATERGLFMSPALYREFLSPEQARLNEAIRAVGAYPIVHNCGKCEEIIPDFIREGYVAWEAAQPINDIEGILETYGREFTVIGGYDSNGHPGSPDATDEEIAAEVYRCLDTYYPHGSYIFQAFRIGGASLTFEEGGKPVDEAYERYAPEISEKYA